MITIEDIDKRLSEIDAALALWDETTNGPWLAKEYQPALSEHTRARYLIVYGVNDKGEDYNRRLIDAGDFAGSAATLDEGDAKFIAAAYEGWPLSLHNERNWLHSLRDLMPRQP